LGSYERAAILPLDRGTIMKKLTYVLAIIAAASTTALAKDLKQNKQAVSATQMSESEMDKTTAGAGFGIGTAQENPGRGGAIGRPDFSPGAPGSGRCIHHGC
jgi:hypothetical protein